MRSLRILILLIFTLLMSCNKNQNQPEEPKETKQQISTPKNVVNTNGLEDFSELVPLTILDATSQDVYEKYGIEFSGNCYDCDLAKININKKYFDFINVCDDENVQRFKIISYSNDNKILKIKTEEHEFLLTKIEDTPIYKLTINGKELALENKRIAVYFTQSKIINKFKEHDCGDFQG